jgi:hypothetical protein
VGEAPPEKQVMTDELSLVVAHEAGHALTGMLAFLWRGEPQGLRVIGATIIPTEDYSGMVEYGSVVDSFDTRNNRDRIFTFMAGSAAEYVFGLSPWQSYLTDSSCRSDVENASIYAQYIKEDHPHGNIEIKEELEQGYFRAVKVLEKFRPAFNALVNELLYKGALSGRRVEQIVLNFYWAIWLKDQEEWDALKEKYNTDSVFAVCMMRSLEKNGYFGRTLRDLGRGR